MVHREAEFDDFAREPLLPWKLSRLGPPLAVSAAGDVYLGGAAGQPGMLRVAGGDGAVLTFPEYAACEDTAALFFDADGDGDDDFYVVSGGVEAEPGSELLRDRLYRNGGDGGWVHDPAAVSGNDVGGCGAAADFDRDGDLDLFVGGRSVPGHYPVPAPSRWLENDGAGRFTEFEPPLGAIPSLAPGTGGIVTGAACADVDGDGWVELILTREWGSPVLIANRGGALSDATAGAGLAGLSGWWTTLVTADLDRDGDTDFAAGNYGLNSKYRASPEAPAVVYYGDFDRSGRSQLIEAEFEDGTLFPGRGRSCSAAAIPGLADKFPSFHAFASASLAEVYSPERLDAAARLEATTLESGAFLNDGHGRFRLVPFPRLAQAAPVFGIAVADVDGDGHPDLYLVGNHFSPQPETGRMDGGLSLLLKGTGDGTFTAVPPATSGLVLPGDSKSVATTDLDRDGHPDLLVGQNDAPLVWFRKRGIGGRAPSRPQPGAPGIQ
jgi:hypothetical protein